MIEWYRAPRIALIGGGKMGEAMMAGWISSDNGVVASWSAENFVVVDPGSERRDYLSLTYGVSCVESVTHVEQADIVVLAVKPQIMQDVLHDIGNAGHVDTALFVSVAAGLATGKLESWLPDAARVIRVMPNLPLTVEEGASAICGGTKVTREEVKFVCELFAALGQAHVIDEVDMDAVCAISGSGPAYVCAMIEALTEAALGEGLSEELAGSLALQTVYGTAKLLTETGQSPTELRKAVSSPNGTTVAALEAMNSAGLHDVYRAGVEAAVRRSKELGA